MLKGQIPTANGTNNRVTGGLPMSSHRPVVHDIFNGPPISEPKSEPFDFRTLKIDVLQSVSKVISERFDTIEDLVTDALNNRMEEIVGTIMHHARKEIEENRLHINMIEVDLKEKYQKEMDVLRKEIERLSSRHVSKTVSPLEKQSETSMVKKNDLYNRERLSVFLDDQKELRPNKKVYSDIPSEPITCFKSFFSAKGNAHTDADVFYLHLGVRNGGFTIIGNLRYVVMIFLILCKYDDYDARVSKTDVMKSYKVNELEFYHKFAKADLSAAGDFYANLTDVKTDMKIKEFLMSVFGSDYF